MRLTSAYLLLLQTVVYSLSTLVVVEEESLDKFSTFLSGLEERGHELTVISGKEAAQTPLIRFEDRMYENLLILADETPAFGGPLKIGTVIDFINLGGNVLLTGAAHSDALQDFAFEFTVDYQSGKVTDSFPSAVSTNAAAIEAANLSLNSPLIVGSIVAGSQNIISALPKGESIYYAGSAHHLSGKNKLIRPLLVARDSAYLGDGKKLTEKSLLGADVVLVSYFEALNNARVVFAGSPDLFSDKFAALPKSASSTFVTQLSKWVFQEKGVVRVAAHHHSRQGETAQHGIYRIKDDLVYTLTLEELKDGKWVPFTPSDVQFEAVMLDPYIRQTMIPTVSSGGSKGSSLEARFKLPDQYGVFTFKVSYLRKGLSAIEVSETVQVRPFRHDQYPRFLVIARPYYANIFSLMAAFFLLSVVFLFHKEVEAKVKTD